MQTLPCSLGRWIARFLTLERGKPRLSALKRWMRLSCPACLRCVESLVERTLPDPGAGKA
ncbi:hypothetical protein T4D_7562 [Trichinella pseudospiralis]|uniref:Uncharacterized protein n=1 Tax=Trichinella pseudospiralis TaxID=6337 RepID=A0A0V1DPB8_TRIPS|nr:hypothetical protein T4D_7562 [Trichinella pseudospiralis]